MKERKEIQAEYRKRKKKAGFKLIQIWSKPEFEGQIRDFNNVLLAKGDKDE